MAIPITKKVAASCAKNMEKGTITYKADGPDMMLIIGEKDKAESEGFTDISKEIGKGFDSVKSKDKEDDES